MKLKLILIGSLFSVLAMSAQTTWSVKELRRRFTVQGELYAFDASGKRALFSASPVHVWKSRKLDGEIDSHWSSASDDYEPVTIHHTWKINDDGTISVHLEQFQNIKPGSNGPEFDKIIKKEDRILENLEPITWVVGQTKEQRIVARFTPIVSEGFSPTDISNIPLAGDDVVITDSQGYVWGEHISHEGKFAGFSTHRGTLFLSFYPFGGGKEMGFASGNEIQVNLDATNWVTLRSKTDYVPKGVQAKVYALYYPDRKSGKFPSTSIMDRNSETEFNKSIPHWPN